MGNAEARKLILSYFNFIVGEEDSHSDIPALKRFIDGRSRVTELLQMRELCPVINSSYKKRELVEYFCNSPRGDGAIAPSIQPVGKQEFNPEAVFALLVIGT